MPEGTGSAAPEPPAWARFHTPRPVTISRYEGDAMEPFLSRDGSLLFFNDSNDPAAQTDLHWAERVDDLTFRYRGRVEGANSAALDGVPTLSRDGRFCFVSPRSYEQTLAAVHCGTWRAGRVTSPVLQGGAAVGIRGRVVFDVELSADGNMLVLADGTFRGGAVPAAADLRLARFREGSYRLSPADDALFAEVNSDALEYAAGLSADARLLAFTRADGVPPFVRTSIWIAARQADAPFSQPVRIDAAEGPNAEGPTFSADGNALYYHRRTGGRFTIWRVTR